MGKKRRGIFFYGIFLPSLLLALWMCWVFGRVFYAKQRFPQMHYVEKEKRSYVTFESKAPKNWVLNKNVSRIAKAAILISEDARFFEHHGFDFEQLQKALQTNLNKKKFARGASTISQQLAKNLFLSREKSILRKVKEVFYTIALEVLFTKAQIFEYYLNIAELGRDIYGVQRASLYYFKKPASALNAKEGAFLATLLPSPIRYSISFHRKELTSYAQKHIALLLTRLVQAGHLNASDAEYLEHFPLPFEMIREDYESEPELVEEAPEPSSDAVVMEKIDSENE